MELKPREVIKLLKGAPAAREQVGRVVPDRFTDLQRTGYPYGGAQYTRTFCHASVTLDFYTDATALSFSYGNLWNETNDTGPCSFDLFLDGVLTKRYHLPVDWTVQRAPDGQLRMALGAGEKRVTLYLTNFFHVELFDVVLEDATFARPYEHRGRFLAFGDSITAGFFSRTPSQTYVNRLSRMLDMEAVNYAIGGEKCRPGVVTPGTYPDCDFVIAAYGTNDFPHTAPEHFRENLPAFHARLHEAFPAVPVFILLPLWRKIADKEKPLGTLRDVSKRIAASAKNYPNFCVIDCVDFLPHEAWPFLDGSLHPNDEGMALYADRLAEVIRKELQL